MKEMPRPTIKFKLLSPDSKLPQYAHSDDAGFDIFSVETVVLEPGQRHVFKTGLTSQIPQGWFVSVRDKSGLAAKHGLHTMGGVIDAGYRGEWGVILVNNGQEVVTIEKGDKIAQGIMQQAEQAQIELVEVLEDTERGEGGFGSTGKK